MGSCFSRCRSNMSILENPPESASADVQDDVFVLLHDCPSFEDAEMSMNAGERLIVLSEDDDFLMVRSSTTGREVYVPTGYVAKVTHGWMFTGISRYKAEELLQHPRNQSGAFLIRKSETNPDCFSLSILRRTGAADPSPVKHYCISRLQNGQLYISPGLTFHSLHHLVDHYSEAADGLCCRLTTSCFVLGVDGAREVPPAPTTIRRPTLNWKEISRSLILKRRRADSGHSLVSEGLRDAISSYLQMTEASHHSWDA